MAEQQTPDLAGTLAVIFGRPVISRLTRRIGTAQAPRGEWVLYQHGRDAGTLAASALPPLMADLGLEITVGLLTRRVTDLQVMRWAAVWRATVSYVQGGGILAGTFEFEAWDGKPLLPGVIFCRDSSPGCSPNAWQRAVDCRETECQAAAGAPSCEFRLPARRLLTRARAPGRTLTATGRAADPGRRPAARPGR